jgi:hypothetical protein
VLSDEVQNGINILINSSTGSNNLSYLLTKEVDWQSATDFAKIETFELFNKVKECRAANLLQV